MEAGGFTKAFPTFWKEKKLKFEKKSFFVTEKWPLAFQSVASFLCVASTWNFFSFVDKKIFFLLKKPFWPRFYNGSANQKLLVYYGFGINYWWWILLNYLHLVLIWLNTKLNRLRKMTKIIRILLQSMFSQHSPLRSLILKLCNWMS